MPTEIGQDELGRPIAAIPVRVVDGATATDETGKTVTAVRARYVDDEPGAPLVQVVEETVAADELGRPLAAVPLRIVDDPTALAVRAGGASGGGALPLPAFDLAAPDWSDDFEVAGELNGSNGWAVLNGNGLLRKHEGSVRVVNQFQAGTIAVAPASALDSENIRFVLDWNTGDASNGLGGVDNGGVWQQSRQSALLWYVDTNNRIIIETDKTNGRINLTRRIAGVNTTESFFLTASDTAYSNRSEIILEIIDGIAYCRFNGKLLVHNVALSYPYHGRSLAAVPPANRLGKVGVNGSTYRWPVAYAMSATRLVVSLDDHSTAIPRDNKDAPGVSGYTFTGKYWHETPSRFAYRVLDYVDDSVVQDWQETEATTFGSGVWSGDVSVPTGGPYQLDFALIDTNGKWHVTRSRPVLVGARYTYFGQSNSTGRNGGAAPNTLSDIAGAQFPASAPNAARAGEPANFLMTRYALTTTSRAYQAARIASEKMGIPVFVTVLGIPGTSIGGLKPGSAGWTQVTTDIALLGPPEGVLWDQGEGEANSSNAAAEGYGESLVADIITPYRTAANDPNLPFLLIDVGRYAATTTASGSSDWPPFDYRNHRIRLEKRDVANADPFVFIGSNHLGQIHFDAYHYTGEGYTEACIRDGFDIAKYFGGIDTPDGRGPIPVGATLNGARNQITIAFDMNGAASLTGLVNKNTGTVPTQPLAGTLHGYRVSIDDFVSLQAISAINSVGNTLVIDMAAPIPAGTVKIDSMYGASFDDRNLFYGTGYADGRADIPVDAIVVPLTAT